jgi:hypothetical protein
MEYHLMLLGVEQEEEEEEKRSAFRFRRSPAKEGVGDV